MVEAEGEPDGVVSRIVRAESVGAVAENISQACRIVLRIMVIEPRPDAPHEAERPSLRREGFAVDEEGSAPLHVPGELSRKRPFVPNHYSRTDAPGVALAVHSVFCGETVGPCHRKAAVKGESGLFVGFLEDMDIHVIDMAVWKGAVLQIFCLDLHIAGHGRNTGSRGQRGQKETRKERGGQSDAFCYHENLSLLAGKCQKTPIYPVVYHISRSQDPQAGQKSLPAVQLVCMDRDQFPVFFRDFLVFTAAP